MNADEALAVLETIDRGELMVEMTNRGEFECHPEYKVSNGWRVRVFDDAGGWDYVDAMAAPGEDWIDLWVHLDHRPPTIPDSAFEPVRMWRPQHTEYWHWCVNGESPAGFICDGD